MSDKSEQEWVVKSTHQNGKVYYGSPTTKAIADAWAERMNQDYPFIKHEATLVDLVPEGVSLVARAAPTVIKLMVVERYIEERKEDE